MDTPRYIDLTTDFGFKRIFSSEPNKELLIAFINALFAGRKKVIDITYNRNEYVGETDEIGTVILDLSCIGSNGEIFVIEMQCSSQLFFKQRILYYGSKLIADQAPKGRRKSWAYNITEVYVIASWTAFLCQTANQQIVSCTMFVCVTGIQVRSFTIGLSFFIWNWLISLKKKRSSKMTWMAGCTC